MKPLKKRAAELLRKGAGEATIFVAFDLLQELVNESEAEPVAWLSVDILGERYLCFSKPLDNDKIVPLYAAPPAPSLLDDVARDAERYRWLREERFDKPYAVTNEHMNAVYEGDELDKAIDAAIKRDKLKGQQP